MTKPNLEEFLEQITDDLVLTDYQKKLAESLIEYYNIHFSGERRTGRSTVFRLVKKYYDTKGMH